tara:strand:+ start:641 stop:991 length:351 start_codon:yes stop_codon:yes gene_type:complete
VTKTFCILKSKKSPVNIEIIPIGFSWLAFFFGPLWALTYKLWKDFLIWFVLLLFVFLLSKYFLATPFFFLILSSFFWGFFAKDILIQNLIKKKFQPVRIVTASNEKNALLTFLSEK